MVIRELTYQLHKLEASESALVSADHHDKKSVLGIGGKNPDRSIPNFHWCMVCYDRTIFENLESEDANNPNIEKISLKIVQIKLLVLIYLQ